VARKLIFTLLLESRLIHKWLDFICLLGLYISKFSNKDNIKNIDRAVGIIQDEEKNEKLHNKMTSLDDKKLEELAHKIAVSVLQHIKVYEGMLTNLYITGGIYFNA